MDHLVDHVRSGKGQDGQGRASQAQARSTGVKCRAVARREMMLNPGMSTHPHSRRGILWLISINVLAKTICLPLTEEMDCRTWFHRVSTLPTANHLDDSYLLPHLSLSCFRPSLNRSRPYFGTVGDPRHLVEKTRDINSKTLQSIEIDPKSLQLFPCWRRVANSVKHALGKFFS
jgi:hypothetical protein